MKRKITDKLCEWKKQTKGRMPLLIYGARQVGKTFEMREFGAHYYKNTVYINFETDEKIGSYFETDIHADSVVDRKSTRLNSSHPSSSRMPSSA